MPDRCDHKSVGMLVWKNDRLLLIERKRFPFGFAPPAGHVDGDGDDFESAAKRELQEEVGLIGNDIKLLTEGRKENHCRREDGNWHYWKIYEVNTNGEIKASEEETKQVGFYDKDELNLLALKTEKYLKGQISREDWEQNPGIEPVWCEWLKELKIISN
ncbi:MAG: NUDIX domain-containing protein [Parcubacteria group bacterium]